MNASKTTVRRGLYGMFAGGMVAAASAVIAMPSANAAPENPANCSASAVATTQSSVQQSVSGYLAGNPEADQALTEIAKQPAAQASASYRTYFAENPTVADELRTIQQPARTLAQQCDLQVMPSKSTEALEAI